MSPPVCFTPLVCTYQTLCFHLNNFLLLTPRNCAEIVRNDGNRRKLTRTPRIHPSVRPSIHASIHQRSANQPTNQPGNNAAKPTNQATNKPNNPSHATLCFPQMLSILGLHCGEALRPHPLLPLFTSTHPSIHPSILPSFHPSIHQPSTQAEKFAYPSSTVSCKQTTASKPSNQRTNIFRPVHDPPITVCVFHKSKQPTSQAAHQAASKPSNQTVFSPNAVDTCFALVAN